MRSGFLPLRSADAAADRDDDPHGVLKNRCGTLTACLFQVGFSSPTDDGVAILLSYGPDRDWLKNITAAGGARVQRMGRTVDLTGPRVMPKAEAATYVTGLSRLIFPRLPFDSAVLLTRR